MRFFLAELRNYAKFCLNNRAFTLVEFLVVITIMGVVSLATLTNLRTATSNQVVPRAVGDLQSLIRVAQANATSSTTCNDKVSWSIKFPNNNSGNVLLICGGETKQTLVFKNAKTLSIRGSSIHCLNDSYPGVDVSINFTPLSGKVDFTGDDCFSDSDSLTIVLAHTADTSDTKSFKVGKGGTIDIK